MAAPSTADAGPRERLVDILAETINSKGKGEERQLDWAGDLLLLVTPEAAMERGPSGTTEGLPLHLVLQLQPPIDFVWALIAAYPEAVKDKDKYGRLPLYLAFDMQAPLGIVRLILEAYPEAARVKSYRGKLPLHLACEKQAPPEVVRLLVEAYPEAVREKGYKGKLSLHYACESKATLEVVRLLVEAHPEAVREEDDDKMLPLHWACYGKATVEVVKLLTVAYLEAVSKKDKDGKLPLHITCEKQPPPEVVWLLVEAHPEAVREKGYKGRLPLHLACIHKAPLEVMRLLMETYPEAAREKDDWGKLPLHLACENEAPLEVVRLLVEAYPEAVREKDKDDGLAIQAIAKIASIEFVMTLLLADLPICSLTGSMADSSEGDVDRVSPVEDHCYSWTVALDQCKDPALAKAIVDRVFGQHFRSSRPHCLALAHAKDEGGREAINLAHSEVQQLMHSYIFFCGRYELQEGPPVHRSATAVVVYALDHGVSVEYGAWFRNKTTGQTSTGTLSQQAFGLVFGELQYTFGGKSDAASSATEKGKASRRASVGTERAIADTFSLWNKSRSGELTAAEFVGGCEGLFGKTRKVAIKFMKNEEQYRQEVAVRVDSALDGKHVVGLLEGPSPEVFGEQVKTLKLHDGQSLEEYQFGLVMPCADRSLDDIVKKERPDLQRIKMMMKDVGEALQHCHEQGVVHGDLKMLNVVRVGAAMKLIDMDAAAIIGIDFACAKFSSGGLPPEMFHELKSEDEERLFNSHFRAVTNAGGEEWVKIRSVDGIVIKTFTPNTANASESLPYALVPASASFDIWSYGAMLFHMCTGESLLPINRDDDLVDGVGRRQALKWTDKQLRRKIGNASINGDSLLARLVKDLLKLILYPDPLRRISLQSVLEHPFFTGKVPARLSAETSVAYDVFISYRVDSNKDAADLLCEKLTARGFRVFLDSKCLVAGVDWEVGFCNGLVSSRCFVPLISRTAIEKRFEDLKEDSYCDNVLLEYRLAVELERRGLLERIFPLFVGDTTNTDAPSTFTKYYPARTASSSSVRQVEDKLAMHLDRQGLGGPLELEPSVAHVLGRVTACQGGFIEGSGSLAVLLDPHAACIHEMVRSLDCKVTTAQALPPPPPINEAVSAESASVSERKLELERRLVDTEARLVDTEARLDEALTLLRAHNLHT